MTVLAVLSGLLSALFVGAPSAHAAATPDLPRSVSTVKATWTPVIGVDYYDKQNHQVWDYEALYSGVIVACGKFVGARDRSTTKLSVVGGVIAFNTTGANRGKLTAFKPSVKNVSSSGVVSEGEVRKCELSYDGKSLILVGSFNRVNGVAVNNVAKVSTSNGQVQAFPVSTNGTVTDLIKAKSRYWLVGNFTTVNGRPSTGIATLNQNGTFSTYYRSKLAGVISATSGRTKAYRCVATGDDLLLLCIVNASSIDGQPRRHLAVWDLGASAATLRLWQLNKSKESTCQRIMAGTGLSIVPGTHDAILTSSGGYNHGICDQTMRFSLDYRSNFVPVKWTNYTCGDSSYAAAATTGAVYSQGHMKCTETRVNGARDWADREGIFALQTSTGNLYSWRSDQSRCDGGKSLYVLNKSGFPPGLFSGSDCDGGVGFRPLSPPR